MTIGFRPCPLQSLADSNCLPQGKSSYSLCFHDDRRGLAKLVRFEADNPAIALEIAQGEAERRWALLMQDDRTLCYLERETAGDGSLWLIASADNVAEKRGSAQGSSPPTSQMQLKIPT